ncbi:WhiB family transcriptional regulator [Streptomyces sp. NPDC004288]|uniref:WhiB family transcriptional regulator n=1 Tax=Streptomyces sp. NPDC005574 TaxID=3156891 RepID=UPI0033AEEB69
MNYTGGRATDWRDAAACHGEDPEIFHAGERNRSATADARAICSRCPVQTGCLAAAYQEGDEYGIRAGMTPRQRNAHLRRADGDISRAVATALQDAALILRNLYHLHAQPTGDGHVLWTDGRHFINVRSKPYTVHQLAWIALHGTQPHGHVQRACDVEGCVAETCLTDRRMREQAAVAV